VRHSRRRPLLLGACFRFSSRYTSAARHCANDMLQVGAAASTSTVKGGTRPLHLLVLAALATAAAAATDALEHSSENMTKHFCTTSTLSDHLGKHGKYVLHQGSGTELSTRFATIGSEEQRRGERRPLAGPRTFDLLVLQMVSQTDGHSDPTRATASHRALSAAESDHDLARRPPALPTVHRLPASPETLPSPTSLQAHLGPELYHLVAWKEHVPTASTA